MNCEQCRRPILNHQRSRQFENVFALIVILWGVVGLGAASVVVESLMATHWLTFLVTSTVYALGTTVLTLWWKTKAL